MKDKIALVTGGTSGIGKEITRELLDKGCEVITCYHNNDEAARETENQFSDKKLTVIKCDVSNEKEVIEMFNFIKQKYGKIDYLVNNAGSNIDGFIKDFDIEDFKNVLNINLLGKVICTKHAYPIMSDGGAIVNIASTLGITPCKESPAYCAGAAAIINFTKATALEYADKSIRANSICPSTTLTPLSLRGWTKEELEEKKNKTPLGRLAIPADTAKLCLFLLSDEASFITGENIYISGGSTI